MKITVNGTEELIEKESFTMAQLLSKHKISNQQNEDVQHNGKQLNKDKFESTYIKDGDIIDFAVHISTTL